MPENRSPKEYFMEYQKHLLIHTNKALFGEIPFLDKYYCPNLNPEITPTSSKEADDSQITTKNCNSSFDDRQSFLLHLCNYHDEFYLRINRRLRETGESVDDSEQFNAKSKEEYDQLKTIKRGLQSKITKEKFEYNIPKTSFGQYICTENDVLDAYEKEHKLSNPDQFLHCTICSKVFKSVENSLLHLFLEHIETFNERLRVIAEQEDELALKNAIEMLSWNNEGSLSTRVSYCCPFGSCSFGKFITLNNLTCTSFY